MLCCCCSNGAQQRTTAAARPDEGRSRRLRERRSRRSAGAVSRPTGRRRVPSRLPHWSGWLSMRSALAVSTPQRAREASHEAEEDSRPLFSPADSLLKALSTPSQAPFPFYIAHLRSLTHPAPSLLRGPPPNSLLTTHSHRSPLQSRAPYGPKTTHTPFSPLGCVPPSLWADEGLRLSGREFKR